MARDLTGKVFRDATVLAAAERRNNKAMWSCRCKCGLLYELYETHLVRGLSGRCHRHLAKLTGVPLKATPSHMSWSAMRERCLRVGHPHYMRYGGRGITICARWGNYENFLSDMGPRPEGMTLDRFPNKDGNYEPGNCRWATPVAQQNNMRTNRYVEYQGQKYTISELSRMLGINYETLYSRVIKGTPLDEWQRPGYRGHP